MAAAVPAKLGCCLERWLILLLCPAALAAADDDVGAAAVVQVWLPMLEVC
jgi:hypothetical protein